MKTKKQKATSDKNWFIYRLRGCISVFSSKNLSMLSGTGSYHATKASYHLKAMLKELTQ